MKRQIKSDAAPGPVGPYSQAIEQDGWIFCSGQVGLDPETGKLVAGGIETEARRALENLKGVLSAAGLSFDDVVKTTIFLADMHDFQTVNRIYGEYASAPHPARSTVQVAALPIGARIEIELIARRRS